MDIMLFSPLLCQGDGLFLTGHGPAFRDFSRSAGVSAPNTHYLGPPMISSNVALLENIPYTLSASCSSLKRATSFPLGPFPDLVPSNSTPLQVYHLCSKEPSPLVTLHLFLQLQMLVITSTTKVTLSWRFQFLDMALCVLTSNHLSSSYQSFLAAIHLLSRPQSYKEATASLWW